MAVVLFSLCSEGQRQSKPHEHAMPIPGMQMGRENHTPISDLRLSAVNAWNAADTSKLISLFGESAVIILPSGKLVTGRQSVRELLQQRVTKHVQVSFKP